MSTRARLGIGPAKAALLGNLKDAANIITIQPKGDSEEELKDFYDTQNRKLEEKLKRITEGAGTLESINEEWLREIESVSDDKRQAPEAKYSQMAANEDGMVNLTERAKDGITAFEMSIADMQRISTIYQGRSVESPTPASSPKLSVSSVKLPKITLPEFHDDPKEWSSFWWP
ncbi:hypothetical protein Tcan_18006 [Toxocara canis]|uniref:Uncharacterized protein n=1 Tax=Toxocara canis TaxID=6265 RepID=A0A0B2VE48_TOXCA|nr:hypothetical protein Tcan_18006 [Toxocara canis]